MDLYTIHSIKTNPFLYDYLRENSSWYKYLNRDGSYLKKLEEEMKTEYKITTKDRLAKLSRDITVISNLIDVLK